MNTTNKPWTTESPSIFAYFGILILGHSLEFFLALISFDFSYMSKHTSIHELLDLQKASPSQFKELNGYTWHNLSVLGKGAFGQVYLGFRNSDKELIAIKIVSKEVLNLEQRVKIFLAREIKIMLSLLGSPYIVQLFHQEECSYGIVLIMELCDSDLEKFLLQNKVC